MKQSSVGSFAGSRPRRRGRIERMVSHRQSAAQLAGIVIGSTIKGVIAGIAIGFFARKVHSLALGILFGPSGGIHPRFHRGANAAWLLFGESFCRGSLVGIIVGYATAAFTAQVLLVSRQLPARRRVSSHKE